MIPDAALGLAWFGGTYVALAFGALVVGPRPWQKAAAIGCALLPMGPAVLLPPPLPMERGLLWLLFALGFMRMLDVTSEADKPLERRLGLALAAASMFGFFVVQGALVGVERALGVARWRSLAARAWTIGTFVSTVPLFVEPALQLAGIQPPECERSSPPADDPRE